MSVAEVERLRRKLSTFDEQFFDGYKVEIVEGNIMMGPVRPHHGETIALLWSTLTAQLPAEWRPVIDVAFVFSDETELCPDVAVIPLAEAERNLGSYPCELIEIAVEVVSPSSREHDYKN